jgi:hypothetical protein
MTMVSISWIQANFRAATARLAGSALHFKEVPRCTSLDNRNPAFAGSLKPSDGLEPSTPSLPWRISGVTRVHVRSLATQLYLQIARFAARSMRRETSRVSFLMCPFCVCGLSSL